MGGEKTRIKPVINCYGGKRRIANLIVDIIRPALKEGSRYYEPFVGGGAVYLALAPDNAVIGDVVPDIINLYECVRDCPGKVVSHYNMFDNNESMYYILRDFDRCPNFQRTDRFFRAARFMFLSRTAYGACTWNKDGEMNQAYNKLRDRPLYCQENDIHAMGKLLKGAEIRLGDYRETLEDVREGDVVYLDPPYANSRYERYWTERFGTEQLEKLKGRCDEMDRAGVKFVLSHSKSGPVEELYHNYRVEPIRTEYQIRKGAVKEIIATNIY